MLNIIVLLIMTFPIGSKKGLKGLNSIKKNKYYFVFQVINVQVRLVFQHIPIRPQSFKNSNIAHRSVIQTLHGPEIRF